MAGSVDNVDFDALVFHRGLFGKNGDASFSFKVVGIHYTFRHSLIFAENAALSEKLIDECGFSVIDVSNNCNISESFL